MSIRKIEKNSEEAEQKTEIQNSDTLKNFRLLFDEKFGVTNTEEEFENVKWLLIERIVGYLKQNGQIIPKECITTNEVSISPVLV